MGFSQLLNVSLDCFSFSLPDAPPEFSISTIILTDCVKACSGMSYYLEQQVCHTLGMRDCIVVSYCMICDANRPPSRLYFGQVQSFNYVLELSPSCFHNHLHVFFINNNFIFRFSLACQVQNYDFYLKVTKKVLSVIFKLSMISI